MISLLGDGSRGKRRRNIWRTNEDWESGDGDITSNRSKGSDPFSGIGISSFVARYAGMGLDLGKRQRYQSQSVR